MSSHRLHLLRMPRGEHNRKLSDAQRDEIIRRYLTPLPDGTWLGVKSLAREYGVAPNSIYMLFQRRGIKTRSVREALKGKRTRSSRRLQIGDPPICKCGCGTSCHWISKRSMWSVYAIGHYRGRASYKNADWLREHYIARSMTLDEIATLSDVNRSSIRKWLIKHDIERRDRSAARIGRQAGAKNSAWRGGVTPDRQRMYKSKEWRDAISACFTRDSYQCVRCGSAKKRKRDLHAHHLHSWADKPASRMDVNNLITLCASCHRWVHSRKNELAEYLA